MGNGVKAQQASYKSRENALGKNREGWLALFADDAVVMDPVGVSLLDPSGKGHRGKEAIGAFYDLIIANTDMDFEIEKSIASGDECANFVVITHKLPGDITLAMDMIVVYTANDDGLIISLKAYWDFEELQQRMTEAMA